ncbi:MAG: hypothetical protein IJZ46_05990 [Bacilli bacterium]|nr:hypothetical protein [Bacilli bacterium]
MNILLIVYLLLIVVSLIISVIVMFKKNIVLGISQFSLSLVVPFITVLIILEKEIKKNAISYLLDEAVKGNVFASIIFILHLVIIGLFIYNLLSFRKKKVEEEEDDRKGKDVK